MPRGMIAHLVHGIGVSDRGRHEGVPHLVMGHDVALLLGEHTAPLFEAGHHAVDRLLEVGHLDSVALLAGGQQGGLVDDVGEVGAREARGALGDDGEVDAGSQGDAAGVNAQDGLATAEVGLVHHDLAVEAAGAQAAPGPAPRGGWWRP